RRHRFVAWLGRDRGGREYWTQAAALRGKCRLRERADLCRGSLRAAQRLPVAEYPARRPASSGKDKGVKAGAAYRFAQGFTLGAVFEHLEYKADDISGLGALTRKVDNWYVSAKYDTGPHTMALAYGHKGEDKLSGAGFS